MLAVIEREELPVADARAGSSEAWNVLFQRYSVAPQRTTRQVQERSYHRLIDYESSPLLLTTTASRIS
jgi:hypothetical protein